jgi:UDP-N-acetylmuramoylalanine--D-glutamate ligase
MLVKKADLIGRKVGILGLGREGRAAREYLRSVFPELELALICESPPDQAFTAQLGETDRLITGPLSRARLERFDLLVRSPGISPYRPSVHAAMKAGVEITTPSNLWFAAHPGEKTICVSGTKGKSTTSALIAHALRSCGYRACLAGNIGRPLLSCDDKDVDWWVIELSSFQLADLKAKPAVAVMLNLSEDHLDWHGSESVYRRDKLRLVELAGDSPVIVNAADPVLADALSGCTDITWFNSAAGIHVEGSLIRDGEEVLPLHVPEELPGPHNLANIAAALSVLKVIGADVLRAARGISLFQSLPHRLQLVGERDGVRFVNDSIASSPVATAAALQAMSGRPVTLIIGGLDRGLDWTPYMRAFESDMPQAVIAIPDNGPRIISTLQNSGLHAELGFHEAADLAEAVELAEKITVAGGVVLLSPGAPSFGQFADYRDRGRQFARFCGFELEEKNKAAGQG